MSPSAPFPGKVVIVTGGSQGVGLGISQAFLKTGAAVVSCARKPFDGCPAATTADERARSMLQRAVSLSVGELPALPMPESRAQLAAPVFNRLE